MSFWKEVAIEMATWCHASATMDIKTVQGRFEHEGVSFLTITLPNYGKWFESSLAHGRVDYEICHGFKYDKSGFPRFLGGFLSRVFDRGTGLLLDEPCIDSIFAIRQLTLIYSKVALPCTDVRERAAMRKYVECEQHVRSKWAMLEEKQSFLLDFDRIAQLLFATGYSNIERELYFGDSLVPRHGPGATSDKLSGNGKYRQLTWPARLNEYFPMWDFLICSPHFEDELEAVDILEPEHEIPVRVISVPKTLKTPRIIGIEPTAMQYAQQSLRPLLEREIGKDDILSRFLGFDDQTPNQEMARKGSLDGSLSTLDLSEASDSVSNQLVLRLMKNFPLLSGAVQACRSRKADVPGEGIIRLSKFASMGSALTFPVEEMVFITVTLLGIERELNRPLNRETLLSLIGQVRVYGDDIIVPTDMASSVVRILETFGFQVNTGKSFYSGNFRESCGRDYFMGHDVSIVKVRQVFPSQRMHVAGIISTVKTRNLFYKKGLWQSCRWLDRHIRKVIKHYPVVLETSPVLGRFSFLGYETKKLGSKLHNPLVKGYVVSALPPPDFLDGHGALLKFFLKQGGQPSVDERHLERAGRPHAVDIKLRWASAV
jgi:hypothetical protein